MTMSTSLPPPQVDIGPAIVIWKLAPNILHLLPSIERVLKKTRKYSNWLRNRSWNVYHVNRHPPQKVLDCWMTNRIIQSGYLFNCYSTFTMIGGHLLITFCSACSILANVKCKVRKLSITTTVKNCLYRIGLSLAQTQSPFDDLLNEEKVAVSLSFFQYSFFFLLKNPNVIRGICGTVLRHFQKTSFSSWAWLFRTSGFFLFPFLPWSFIGLSNNSWRSTKNKNSC